MDSRTQERVEQWDSRPFDGGYDGLSDLAETNFSGAVTAAGTWLFMLNGRIVGVMDGEIEDFESASGTRYDAPHPSLPLLCSMEERGGETRANYYTNETPLREVDATLQDSSFTGYIELSENVLSGDYYAVYYGGRRMAAAYIGSAERLLTDDEAFDRADDEVGIYEVIDVDIDVTDVPGTGNVEAVPDDSASSTSATAPDDPTPTPHVDSEAANSRGDEATTADETASTIESIDFAGVDEPSDASDADETDDSTSTPEINLTDELTGITATEESEPEPMSAGIIDAEPETTSTPDHDQSDADDRTVSDVAGDTSVDAAAIDDEPASELPIEEPEATDTATPEVPIEDTEPDIDTGDALEDVADQQSTPATDSIVSGDEPTPAETAESADASATPDADADSPSKPDLAEVEAAAEELDQNDISWVEDESEESPTDDTTDTDGGDSSPTSESEAREERFQEEAQWREARSIPSIDPDNSETPSPPSTEMQSSSSPAGSASTDTGRDGAGDEIEPEDSQEPMTLEQESAQPQAEQQSQGRSQNADQIRAEARDRIQKLTERLETLEEQRDALREHSNDLETERDQLRSKNQELASTVERLQTRINELESELDRARNAAADTETQSSAAGGSVSAGTELQPKRALSETNLFVRYGSKSQPTLETAHGGDADRDEVANNLRLEHHTQFDTADVVVDGSPYEDFLTSTMAYRFVNWLTEMLLYEIRDTGNADGLGDLYDAIPRIDRAELHSTVSLEDDETDDVPDQVTFDVVAYDKMGNPLVLANLNDSRSPATEGMLAEMEEAASAVKANYPDLAAAIVVTSSYFEPGALEIAEQATSSSFLSRGSKLSYVNLSRKSGYHLCLVEARAEGFHMNVPEL